MIDKIIELSILSGGLLPLMALLLLVTIAVIIERWYFFHRVLHSGLAMEHDLQLVEYQNLAKLKKIDAHYEGSLQSTIVSAALTSRGEDAETMERHIDEAIMWQLPKIDRNVWVLDTSVTLGPFMGLLGTVVGMIYTFDILGVQGPGGDSAAAAVTTGIAEALVATGAGLLIAIVAIVGLNYFNKRVRLAMHQMDLLKVMVVNRLHGGGAGGQGQPVEEAGDELVTPLNPAGAH